MKQILITFILILCFSCGNEKVLHLPEISHSEITDIKDVSHAYLFYDETKTGSVELNRKNLISTTNWLINVDKRLTLKQAIPHIKYLQDKKANSSHKKEGVKNYFTCNDKSRKNLGFVEFTSIYYNIDKPDIVPSDISDLDYSGNIKTILFNLNEKISIINGNSWPLIIKTNKDELIKDLKQIDSIKSRINLKFHEDLSFQDYITYKSLTQNLNLKHTTISNQEYLYN